MSTVSADEQFERAFRANRDDALENGYELICPVCGCAFNGDGEGDEWSLSHDGPLHEAYDARVKP